MTGPQLTLAALWVISLCLHARDHGKPKTGKNSFWNGLIGVGISFAITYWGGFWGHR